MKVHLSELLEATQKFISQGCAIQLLGDFNLQIGNTIIKKNHPDSNPNGRLFLSMIEKMGLRIMNTLSDDPITFIDRSGKNHKRVCLDLVLTNMPQAVSGFKTDTKEEFTPYSVHIRKKVTSRTYADHRSVIFDFETKWKDRVKFVQETK